MDTPETTLYDKLGGQQAIEQVVDDFHKLVLADDSVNHYFAHTWIGTNGEGLSVLQADGTSL